LPAEKLFISLYLDEDVSVKIATNLRNRGFDSGFFQSFMPRIKVRNDIVEEIHPLNFSPSVGTINILN
jgi:hypothetical protein